MRLGAKIALAASVANTNPDWPTGFALDVQSPVPGATAADHHPHAPSGIATAALDQRILPRILRGHVDFKGRKVFRHPLPGDELEDQTAHPDHHQEAEKHNGRLPGG